MVPYPSRLTPEQRVACQRFAILALGSPLFTDEPSHNGRHGWTCETCVTVLVAAEAERERARAIRQPWENAA